MNNEAGDRSDHESPPIFKRWSRLYSLVIINLIFWLTFFYILQKVFE